MRFSITFLSILSSIGMFSCLSEHTELARAVDPLGWKPEDTVTISMPNRDTMSLRNISLFIRSDKRITEREFRLNIRVSAPDSTYTQESLIFTPQTVIRTPAGGYEAKGLYRVNCVLCHQGSYICRIWPESIENGISSVGLSIENIGLEEKDKNGKK